MDADSFEPIARDWLSTFQQDLKDFVHVVCDDPELEDNLRSAAAASVLYALAPGDVIPDSQGPLGFLDDALALRVVLAEIAELAPARLQNYRERIPELIDNLGEGIEAAKTFLVETYEPFRQRVLDTGRIEFKGKRVPDVLADPEWLEAEVSVISLKLDFKPEALNAALKKVHTVPGIFRQKLIPKK